MKSFFSFARIKWILSVIICSALLYTLSTNVRNVLAVSESNNTYEDLKIFSEVLQNIQENYVEELYSDKLIEGAINGMLRTLDAHSSYMNKEMYHEMQIETEGEFGGLGIEITMRDTILTVVSPIEDTPAFEAGVKAGDKIIKVDGISTKGMNLTDAVKLMRGPKGSKVTITVVREKLDKPKDIDIIRDTIKLKSVKFRDFNDDIGYIRISNFSKSTGDDMEEALFKLEEKNIRGLILDLRYNPGGLLTQAVEVVEKFLKRGELIVYIKGRDEENTQRFKSNTRKVHNGYPLVILVNGGSASASEIVSGALQDTKKAIIMGTQTFGKGSVQTIIPLTNGSGIRLTTAKYYTPSGKVIHGKGITPDIIVEERIIEDDDEKQPKMIREADLEKHLNIKESSIKSKHEKANHNETKKIDSEKIEPEKTDAEKLKEKKSNETDKMRKDFQLQSAISLIKGLNIFGHTLQN